jgi:hypothetical protein
MTDPTEPVGVSGLPRVGRTAIDADAAIGAILFVVISALAIAEALVVTIATLADIPACL